MNATTILTAAAIAAAFVMGVAQATPQEAGEAYGYTSRVNDQRSSYTDGAHLTNRDVYTDGARISNRDGLTASIGNRDVYTDGALA
ncbi:hypothetical protein [Cupriavidus sp. CP313]